REAGEVGRPVLDHVLVATVEVALVVPEAADAGHREVAERVDRVGGDLVRRVPTADHDAAPAALEADAAVTRRERRVVLVRLECGFQLEEGLQSGAEIFGAAHAEERSLVVDPRPTRNGRIAAARLAFDRYDR